MEVGWAQALGALGMLLVLELCSLKFRNISFQCMAYLFVIVAVPVVLSKSSLILGKVLKLEDIVCVVQQAFSVARC